ncbi:sigma-70 family RNA polymerase sigma factor [Sphingobacterium sp. SGG-5]|uniref:RNA polymerase sigma factor n=1 Tax=Sphingobacterium sp. SGG-5 TaxID=2710881 RepID=UPI0013EB5745|nr:sigma-70 family RNA polymerase sigma factor [Sphingobacterium sp. SGG-5]NGM62483.1 sigma-70 family RNA polymerase sigma factor [Sphingobacterium sp. SGG-5]
MKKVSKAVFVDFKAGYSKAFRILFDLHHHAILQHAYGFCHQREEAEEIVQDAFTQLFVYRDRMRDEESILPFLYAVSKRIAISHFRRKIIREEAVTYTAERALRNPYDTQETVLVKELKDKLEQIISELPQQQQKVFVLNKLDDLSYQEIAEQLALSKNTVKNHLTVATKTVRVKLQRLMYLFF